MPVYLGSKNVGVGIVTKLWGGDINNQNKTIDKNGTYTADEGFTGLGTVIVDVDTVNNTTLSITPKTKEQTFTPSSNYTGYSNVTVAPVTSAIDSDILPENIKKGKNILGVEGTVLEVIPQTKIINENGTYEPEGNSNAFTKVIVQVPTVNAVLEDLNITENGTYTASEGYDGLGTVIVNVEGSGGDVTEVNNQELTVTDNGVYFPDPGYTGFGKVLVNVEKVSSGDTLLLKNDSGEDLNIGDNILFNVGGSTSETDVQVKLTTTSSYSDKGSIFIDNDSVYVNYQNSDSVYKFVNNRWEQLDRKGWGESRSRGAVIAFPQDRERIAFHRRGTGNSYLLYKNIMFTITDHQYIGRYNGKYYVVSKSDNNIKEYLPETNSIVDTILFNKANDNHTSYIDELTGRGASFDHTGNIDFFQIDENGTFVQTGTVDVVLRDSAEIVCFTGVDEGDYLFYGTNYNGKYYNNGESTPSILKSNLIVYKIVKNDIGEYNAVPINDQLQGFANEDCFVNFDLRNDVLCIGTRKGIFGFDFNRTTGKFIPIPLNISLPDNGNEEYPYYFCMSPDKTKAIVTVRTKNDSMNIGLYTIGVKEYSIIKNEFNQYNPSNTFTGVVTSGSNEEGKYEIKCILPQEIELELNTDIDILENEFIIEGGI